MKKILIGILVTVAVLAVGGAVLCRVAEQKLHSVLADIPGARIDFKKVRLSPILGNLEFRDVEVALRDSTGTGPEIEGRIESIQLERLRWRSLIHGEACANRLLIQGPEARLVLAGKPAEEKKDSAANSPNASFLKKVSLSELRVENGKIGLENQNDSLKVAAQDITLSVRDIGILLAENRVEYNDSIYCVSLDSLDYTDAPGLSRIQIGHLGTADAGPIEGLDMHLYNCVPMEQVAERMGKVAAMWYDVKLDSLYTSPLNIPRLVKEQQIDIERIHLSSSKVVLFQDDRYPPAVPYPTLQESLNTLELPLHIRQIDAGITAFTFIWETTHVNRGTFPLHNVRLDIGSVSNAPDNVMKLGIRSGDKRHGTLDLSVSIRNDKRESTHGTMRINGLDASRLDSFLRPLFGATAKADIHKIDSQFKGDKNQMTEDFCMLYDHLSLHAWDDVGAPFKIVAKNSGVVTLLANIAAPDSNPVKAGKEPKKVEVSFERDPMQPYPAYLIQNLTMGMLRTVLPGGAVHKKKK